MRVKSIPGWTKFKAYTSKELEEQKGITIIELRSGYGEGWRYQGKLSKCEFFGIKTGPLGELFKNGNIMITKSQVSTGPSKSAGIFLKVDKLAFKKCQALGAIQIIHGIWEFWHNGARLNPAMGGGEAVRTPTTPQTVSPTSNDQQGQPGPPAQNQAGSPGQSKPSEEEVGTDGSILMEEDLNQSEGEPNDIEIGDEEKLLGSP